MKVEYIIIILVCLIIAIAITRAKRKDFKLEANKLVMLLGGKDNVIDYEFNKSNTKLELNKLVDYLGGKDNILETEAEMSRFKVTLKDVSKANKEAIQRMGAQGIVEIDNQLKIILGDNAKQIKKHINDLKW